MDSLTDDPLEMSYSTSSVESDILTLTATSSLRHRQFIYHCSSAFYSSWRLWQYFIVWLRLHFASWSLPDHFLAIFTVLCWRGVTEDRFDSFTRHYGCLLSYAWSVSSFVFRRSV